MYNLKKCLLADCCFCPKCSDDIHQQTPNPLYICEPGQKKKLLDLYRDAMRVRHYSHRTEETYVSWIRQFILYHNKRHPRDMGIEEINAFITYLVKERNVAASTQNQALSSILFLYRNVLDIPLDETALIPLRPSKPKRVPTVLSPVEAKKVIEKMDGVYKIMA